MLSPTCRPEVTTLAEILHASGIHTAAIVASFALHSIFGLNRGFMLYDEDFSAPLALQAPPDSPERHFRDENTRQMSRFLMHKALHDAYRPDNELSDRAIRWLRDERREPFFLWLHYFGPHEKPQAIDDYNEERRLQLAEYDRDVVTADEQVGRILTTLDGLGLAENTAVLLHADHGQSLTEHDSFGHGRDLYDPVQRVPLLMRLPGRLSAGKRVRRLVRNLDLFPTILDLAKATARDQTDGRSLLRVIERENGGGPEETYMETYLPANWLFANIIDEEHDVRVAYRRLGIRTPRWKFVVNDPIPFVELADRASVTDAERPGYYSEELYDLAADPEETTNVVEAHRDIAALFLHEVWSHQPREPPSPAMPLDDETRARLKSLGYLAD